MNALPKAPPPRPRLASLGRWCLAICALISLGLWFGAGRIAEKEAEANAHAAIAANEPYWRLFRQPFGEVRAGGYVLSEDPETGELTPKPVVQAFRSHADHLRIVEFETADGAKQLLRTTDEHPFWVPDLSADVNAGELYIGQKVKAPDGTLQTLVSSAREEHLDGVEVANFEVADFHRYFVIAKEGNGIPILVHNAEGCLPKATSARKYLTYTAREAGTGKTYVGRTSGFGTVKEILDRRARSHHRNLGELKLDRVSSSYRAIRGREQLLFDAMGRRAADQIRPISLRNKNIEDYLQAARQYLGP